MENPYQFVSRPYHLDDVPVIRPRSDRHHSYYDEVHEPDPRPTGQEMKNKKEVALKKLPSQMDRHGMTAIVEQTGKGEGKWVIKIYHKATGTFTNSQVGEFDTCQDAVEFMHLDGSVRHLMSFEWAKRSIEEQFGKGKA